MSGGNSVDTSFPSTSMTPRRSSRARAAAIPAQHFASRPDDPDVRRRRWNHLRRRGSLDLERARRARRTDPAEHEPRGSRRDVGSRAPRGRRTRASRPPRSSSSSRTTVRIPPRAGRGEAAARRRAPAREGGPTLTARSASTNPDASRGRASPGSASPSTTSATTATPRRRRVQGPHRVRAQPNTGRRVWIVHPQRRRPRAHHRVGRPVARRGVPPRLDRPKEPVIEPGPKPRRARRPCSADPRRRAERCANPSRDFDRTKPTLRAAERATRLVPTTEASPTAPTAEHLGRHWHAGAPWSRQPV